MKSLIITLVLFTSAAVFAQSPFSEGTINLNGNLSFTSQSYENSDNTRNTFMLNPQAGYFIIGNFSLGLSVNLNYITLGNDDVTTWGVGPRARYYFDAQNVKPFVSVGYSYAKHATGNSNYDRTGSSFTFAGGLDYFIVKNVAIETMLSYRIQNTELPDDLYSDSSETSSIIQFAVGINFFLY